MSWPGDGYADEETIAAEAPRRVSHEVATAVPGEVAPAAQTGTVAAAKMTFASTEQTGMIMNASAPQQIIASTPGTPQIPALVHPARNGLRGRIDQLLHTRLAQSRPGGFASPPPSRSCGPWPNGASQSNPATRTI